jgi:hypothetical protein
MLLAIARALELMQTKCSNVAWTAVCTAAELVVTTRMHKVFEFAGDAQRINPAAQCGLSLIDAGSAWSISTARQTSEEAAAVEGWMTSSIGPSLHRFTD